jgi:hypothetical protein
MKARIIAVVTALSLCHAASSQVWNTSGNAGTNAAFNYLGTTDNSEFIIRTNGVERMRFSPASTKIGIGLSNFDNSPYGGTIAMKGTNGTALDLVRGIAPGSTAWDCQIRFYNTNSLRHVITDDYLRNKLIIAPGIDPNSGALNVAQVQGTLIVGIDADNVTTPPGYRLFVQEGILAERVKVALKGTGQWSDYVFKQDYHLMPLDQLEKFVNTKSHLPGIPSAEEMVKEGLDLGQMDAKLLEKIEELTLYIIDLNKQLQAQKKEIETLKQSVNKN